MHFLTRSLVWQAPSLGCERLRHGQVNHWYEDKWSDAPVLVAYLAVRVGPRVWTREENINWKSVHISLYPVLQFSCYYLGCFYPTCAFCQFCVASYHNRSVRSCSSDPSGGVCIALPFRICIAPVKPMSTPKHRRVRYFSVCSTIYGMYFTHRARTLPRPVESSIR